MMPDNKICFAMPATDTIKITEIALTHKTLNLMENSLSLKHGM